MSSKSRPKTSLKECKIQLCLRHEQKDLIARVARAEKTILTDFILKHALAAAQEVLAGQTHFSLSPERWDAFCAALECATQGRARLAQTLEEIQRVR